MKWHDQNKIGISWNSIVESQRKMWAVYHSMPEGDAKKSFKSVIEEITEKFQKMSGVVDSAA